jgi:CIC family chloride channel protein
MTDDGAGTDEPPPRSHEPRKREPSVVDSITASQSIVSGKVSELQRTGFFKPLSAASRLERLWARFGLMLGRRLATVLRDDHVFMIIMAAVVGITSGAAAGGLLWWIDSAIALFPRPDEGDAWLRWSVVILVPVLGGLLAGGLRVVSDRVVRDQVVVGVPGIIEAIDKQGGTVHGRGGVVTGLGTGVTIGSGGSCGHEGPSVAIGAAVGSALARFFGLRMRRHLAMVGAGCAGGLAAAFNAPLAGVIFTVELVFGGAIGGNVGTMSVFIPLIVAAVSGTFTAHAIFGDHSAFDIAAHDVPALTELAFYVGMAVLAGFIGSLMSRAVLEATSRFEALRAPVWVKPALGALGVGLMAALVSNEVLGAGHSTVERALHGDLGWKLAALLLVAKIAATALTVGSGGFGGVFMPSLYVGACMGTLVGLLAYLALGSVVQDTGAYALVGMGAIFAAMMHAPLTPIVMIFELTRDWGIILPLMLACILSTVVARRVNALSFYKMVLKHRGVILSHEAEGEVMKRGQVRELMIATQTVLTAQAGVEEVRRVVLDADLRATFVVNDDATVAGYINGNQLAKRMLNAQVHPESTARDLMGQSDLTLLYPHDTLAAAMLAFARSGQEILPVVDNERHLLGVIRRGDLMAHYSDKVLGEQEEVVQIHAGERGPDQEVGLGKGLVLERIIVGRSWAGRSLTDLELRRRTGVMVLEWCRGDSVMVVDPRRPMREGDTLAVCGTREQLLQARSVS